MDPREARPYSRRTPGWNHGNLLKVTGSGHLEPSCGLHVSFRPYGQNGLRRAVRDHHGRPAPRRSPRFREIVPLFPAFAIDPPAISLL